MEAFWLEKRAVGLLRSYTLRGIFSLSILARLGDEERVAIYQPPNKQKEKEEKFSFCLLFFKGWYEKKERIGGTVTKGSSVGITKDIPTCGKTGK